jgi:hypothetical protein
MNQKKGQRGSDTAVIKHRVFIDPHLVSDGILCEVFQSEIGLSTGTKQVRKFLKKFLI